MKYSSDEIGNLVDALRCCAEGECHGCAWYPDKQHCQERILLAAANIIEGFQKEAANECR